MKEMTDYDRFLERQRIADERALKMGYGKAVQDAIVGGVGITKNGERIDPASIYAEPVPLTELLNNPEEHYPGNFDTPERANALLTGLCQDAATEIDRLNKALTWEQNRSGRIGTHGPGCHLWGASHYECLLRELQARTMDFKAGKEVRTHTPEDVQKIKSAWVGLTDEERDAMADMRSDKWRFLFRRHAKAVERVLKERNHG